MVRENRKVRMEMLRYLARMASRGEGPPSVREVGQAVGLRSSQTAYKHLKKLEEEGYVEREGARRRARGIRLTEKGWEAAGELPLMGRIAAGRGLEAVALGDEAYSLAAELLGSRSGRRRYLLRVVGQSMIGAHIADGDLLVVEEDEDPPDGAVVAALLRGGEEVTVKRLYREGEMVRLEPENGDHEDIVLPAEDVRIQGRVLYVVHPPRGRR
ncbi:LexA repressor [Rubrobacter xylanophilus DSM 9941]|uniref:transcriptional repressor LexA n=1 Tax=Rubrobacter xylanophilus TaxID=49319 RepID=UPI001C644970|nr:transcriptional repressor LexA [Rubrobacter xylanophilus]QYJ15616.1 LexA repressor [Rubrobacter xylanophilus DSM 9941]